MSCSALATYSDGTTSDVTGTATWASDATTVASTAGLVTVGPNQFELFTINGNGTANVTAAQGSPLVTSPKVCSGAAEVSDGSLIRAVLRRRRASGSHHVDLG